LTRYRIKNYSPADGWGVFLFEGRSAWSRIDRSFSRKPCFQFANS